MTQNHSSANDRLTICRKAFEDWAKDDKFFNSKKVKNMYVDSHVNVAWKIWQAAWEALNECKR